MAIVSHYLHNQGYKFAKPYEEKAEGLIEDIYNVRPRVVENNCVSDAGVQYSLFSELFSVPFLPTENPRFTFIDLFAGIGGFRMAMQNLGGKCVFSSEWDAQAQKTYLLNYGEVPFGDITKESTKAFIPDGFDILCAGFPCQAFSIAGLRKGFEDERGNLFFEIERILRVKRPRAVLLENVRNLESHDNGNTFRVIREHLQALGYYVCHRVLNTMEYGNVPQHRERIYIVGFLDEEAYNRFEFPDAIPLTRTIHDIIDATEKKPLGLYYDNSKYYPILREAMTNKNTVYQWRRVYCRENKSNVCPTLTANMGTGGHNVPLIIDDFGIRKLTPEECVGFQGFPEEFSFPSTISNASKYKQAGNSVSVPVIRRIAEKMIAALNS
jgi:DNA (cytosine-5)-methyltransferase 1